MILLGSSKTAGNQIFSVILISVLSWDKKYLLKITVHNTHVLSSARFAKFILFALAVGFGAACQIRITGEGLCTSLALSCGGKYCICKNEMQNKTKVQNKKYKYTKKAKCKSKIRITGQGLCKSLAPSHDEIFFQSAHITDRDFLPSTCCVCLFFFVQT